MSDSMPPPPKPIAFCSKCARSGVLGVCDDYPACPAGLREAYEEILSIMQEYDDGPYDGLLSLMRRVFFTPELSPLPFPNPSPALYSPYWSSIGRGFIYP